MVDHCCARNRASSATRPAAQNIQGFISDTAGSAKHQISAVKTQRQAEQNTQSAPQTRSGRQRRTQHSPASGYIPTPIGLRSCRGARSEVIRATFDAHVGALHPQTEVIRAILFEGGPCLRAHLVADRVVVASHPRNQPRNLSRRRQPIVALLVLRSRRRRPRLRRCSVARPA